MCEARYHGSFGKQSHDTCIWLDIIKYLFSHDCCKVWIFHSTDTFLSWSKKGIETRAVADSSKVKCLSYHLSNFAVIAENTTIEATTEPPISSTTEQTSAIPSTEITSTTNTSSSTGVPTSTKL